MATIDLTLDALKIPNINGTFPFGTKITQTELNHGGLSTTEVNSNVMLPFMQMRPKVCDENSDTSQVEYDAKVVFNAPAGTTPSAGYTLTMGNGTYVGCTVTYTNLMEYACTVKQSGGTTTLFSIPAGKTMSAMWTGTAWRWTTSGTVSANDPTPVSSAAVHAAIDQKETIPLSQILTVTNVSSTNYNVTLGEWVWTSDSYAIPLKDRYYVHGRVWIGNGIGCTIPANGDCHISITTNKTVFSTIIYPFMSGFIGVVPIYGDELSDFWVKNLNSDITWNNTYKLGVTFSGWVNR